MTAQEVFAELNIITYDFSPGLLLQCLNWSVAFLPKYLYHIFFFREYATRLSSL